MNKFLHIGTYFGVPIKIHWTFIFIVLFVTYFCYTTALTQREIVGFILYVISVFSCVILHEYGHIFAARRYHINTQDIILTPIGGIARLEQLPKDPSSELVVAFCGPLVNFTIAGFLWLYLNFRGIGIILPDVENELMVLANPIGFIHALLFINVILGLFNLIPAFPMDGGRILRALLSYKFSRLLATKVAVVIGRVLAIGLLIIALRYNFPSMGAIAIFIFLASAREYQYIKRSERP